MHKKEKRTEGRMDLHMLPQCCHGFWVEIDALGARLLLASCSSVELTHMHAHCTPASVWRRRTPEVWPHVSVCYGTIGWSG